ncbi:hypothetical protein EDC01DRAFT_447034 [Geopyxis carbonaria]|nr:hypothetical protein EDC01DRAFT_447034 [Geopyxis carbonaria]
MLVRVSALSVGLRTAQFLFHLSQSTKYLWIVLYLGVIFASNLAAEPHQTIPWPNQCCAPELLDRFASIVFPESHSSESSFSLAELLLPVSIFKVGCIMAGRPAAKRGAGHRYHRFWWIDTKSFVQSLITGGSLRYNLQTSFVVRMKDV